jgi:hypothetical protein
MRIEIPWQVDESGMLSGAAVHDAILEGFGFSESRLLGMIVRRIDGTVVELEAHGVKRLNICEMWEASIVSEIFVWKSDAAPSYASSMAWQGLLRNRIVKGNETPAAEALVKEYPETVLVQLSCSYGASVFALCDQFKVFEIT